jgi:hypothetical protein
VPGDGAQTGKYFLDELTSAWLKNSRRVWLVWQQAAPKFFSRMERNVVPPVLWMCKKTIMAGGKIAACLKTSLRLLPITAFLVNFADIPEKGEVI